MEFDEKIQNLTQQIAAASRDVIIQDRVLGQARERVAEIQGRINMLAELQQEEKPTAAAAVKQPVPGTRKPGSKPGPKPKPEKKREQFRYPNGLRNFCIKNIDKMKNQELIEAANKEFDLDMDYNRFASYIKYNNIKRSKEAKKEPKILPPEDDY